MNMTKADTKGMSAGKMAPRGMRWRRGIFLLKRCLNRVLPGCTFMFSNQKHGIEDPALASEI